MYLSAVETVYNDRVTSSTKISFSESLYLITFKYLLFISQGIRRFLHWWFVVALYIDLNAMVYKYFYNQEREYERWEYVRTYVDLFELEKLTLVELFTEMSKSDDTVLKSQHF